MRYLDFENEEKGFKVFQVTRETIRANIGKRICFVNSHHVDKHRGYYTVVYATITSINYSHLLLNGGQDSVDIRDIAECGIEIAESK